MKTVKLLFDFNAGPLWPTCFDNGKHITGIPVIDNDRKLWEWNAVLQDMYSCCYEFDVDDQPCVFKYGNADPNVMMDLLNRLKARLNELNDGSFVIKDYATPELEHWDEMPDII